MRHPPAHRSEAPRRTSAVTELDMGRSRGRSGVRAVAVRLSGVESAITYNRWLTDVCRTERPRGPWRSPAARGH